MTTEPSRSSRLWALTAAFIVFLFGFFPVANWIPGGRDWPRYGADLEGWIAGSAIALGVGIVYMIAARRVPALWRDDACASLVRVWVRHSRATTLVLVLMSLVLYVFTAHHVFSGRPLLVDEVAMLFQARVFAHGQIAGVLDPAPELFSALHLVERNGCSRSFLLVVLRCCPLV